jgi:hypothetical protein
LAGDPELVSETDKTINQMLQKELRKLSVYTDVELIEAYAKEFSQDPNRVEAETDFDTIIMFNVKWKLQGEFQKKKADIERIMSNPVAPK